MLAAPDGESSISREPWAVNRRPGYLTRDNSILHHPIFSKLKNAHAAIRLPPQILCFGQFPSLQRNKTHPEGAPTSRGVELNVPGGLFCPWRALNLSGGSRVRLEACGGMRGPLEYHIFCYSRGIQTSQVTGASDAVQRIRF